MNKSESLYFLMMKMKDGETAGVVRRPFSGSHLNYPVIIFKDESKDFIIQHGKWNGNQRETNLIFGNPNIPKSVVFDKILKHHFISDVPCFTLVKNEKFFDGLYKELKNDPIAEAV